MDGQQRITIKGSRKFSNNLRGWKSLQAWICRFRKNAEVPLVLVVEATGVYYEGFAYHFKTQGHVLHVVLPNKSKHFAKSLNVKTKNDAVDAALLSRMGLERSLPVWKGTTPIIQKIKQLSRQRAALQQMRTRVSNQLHTHGHAPQKGIVQGMHQHLKFLDKQIKSLEDELIRSAANDPELKQKLDNICTIKGIGMMTALTVVAETNGFDLIENKAQLVSYAGYDVVENQSGSSLNGKNRAQADDLFPTFAQQNAGKLRISPNPAQGFINVDTRGQSGEMTLYNALGHQVRRVSVGSSVTELSVEDLSPGVYQVVFMGEQSVMHGTLVVQR